MQVNLNTLPSTYAADLRYISPQFGVLTHSSQKSLEAASRDLNLLLGQDGNSIFDLMRSKIDPKLLTSVIEVNATGHNTLYGKPGTATSNPLDLFEKAIIPYFNYLSSFGQQPVDVINAQFSPKRLIVQKTGSSVKVSAYTYQDQYNTLTPLIGKQANRFIEIGLNPNQPSITYGPSKISYSSGSNFPLFGKVMLKAFYISTLASIARNEDFLQTEAGKALAPLPNEKGLSHQGDRDTFSKGSPTLEPATDKLMTQATELLKALPAWKKLKLAAQLIFSDKPEDREVLNALENHWPGFMGTAISIVRRRKPSIDSLSSESGTD